MVYTLHLTPHFLIDIDAVNMVIFENAQLGVNPFPDDIIAWIQFPYYWTFMRGSTGYM